MCDWNLLKVQSELVILESGHTLVRCDEYPEHLKPDADDKNIDVYHNKIHDVICDATNQTFGELQAQVCQASDKEPPAQRHVSSSSGCQHEQGGGPEGALPDVGAVPTEGVHLGHEQEFASRDSRRSNAEDQDRTSEVKRGAPGDGKDTGFADSNYWQRWYRDSRQAPEDAHRCEDLPDRVGRGKGDYDLHTGQAQGCELPPDCGDQSSVLPVGSGHNDRVQEVSSNADRVRGLCDPDAGERNSILHQDTVPGLWHVGTLEGSMPSDLLFGKGRRSLRDENQDERDDSENGENGKWLHASHRSFCVDGRSDELQAEPFDGGREGEQELVREEFGGHDPRGVGEGQVYDCIPAEVIREDAHVAQALSHCKITPRRVFTLSKRKKKMLDFQWSQEHKLRDQVQSQAGIKLDDLVGYMRKNPRKLPCIAEVMSPPRVVPVGVKAGCRNGGSFDLQNGWDFLDDKQQDACLEQMEQHDVDAVIVTPPCDQFSQLQNMSKGKGDPLLREQRLREAIKLLKFGPNKRPRVQTWVLLAPTTHPLLLSCIKCR